MIIICEDCDMKCELNHHMAVVFESVKDTILIDLACSSAWFTRWSAFSMASGGAWLSDIWRVYFHPLQCVWGRKRIFLLSGTYNFFYTGPPGEFWSQTLNSLLSNIQLLFPFELTRKNGKSPVTGNDTNRGFQLNWKDVREIHTQMPIQLCPSMYLFYLFCLIFGPISQPKTILFTNRAICGRINCQMVCNPLWVFFDEILYF